MKTDKKLSAFLHDTVDKPLILMTGHERHESRAKKIADILGISINEDDFRGADWIASAMDRLLMPRIGKNNPGFQVKFTESPKIIHPTSGDAMELGLSFSLAEVDSAVTMSFQRISEMGLSKESLYHYLWRKIRDELKGNSGRQWRKIWDILPADTRVPDHTIWDHLKVTCSCSAASYTDSNRLYNRLGTFIFTIGPVQSFIQNARKTQDLWMGSYILSYLNWMAIKSVIEEHGPDCVIYPDLYLQPMVDYWLHNDKGIEIDNINSIDMLTPTIPNRFLAILPIDDIEEIGRKAEDAVRSEFRRMAEFVFDEFFSDWRNTYAREMLDSQIDNFLDIFWVGTPWYSSDEKAPDWQNAISNLKSYVPQKSSDYGEFLRSLSKKGEYPPNIGTLYGLLHCISERSLGCVKNIRPFTQIEETGRKCSLCGERDIIRLYKDTGIRDSMRIWDKLREKNRKYISSNEALCSVCLVKRAGDIYFEKELGLSNISFPSTSEVSTSSFKQRVHSKIELHDLYKDYSRELDKLVKPNKAKPLPKLQASVSKVFSQGFALPAKQDIVLFNKKVDDIDGEWLFPESLDSKYIYDQSGERLSDDELKSLIDKQKALIKLANCKPGKYYAIIMMDGDDMGKWLSGDLLPELKDTIHPEIRDNVINAYGEIIRGRRMIKPSVHAFISSALRDFSLKIVKRIVEHDHLGKVIYSGGDDVLAMVNLDDLFDVMIKLRSAFSGNVDRDMNICFDETACSGFIETDDGYLLTMGSKATISAGVVIAHHKMPLREALGWARQMESEAKGIDKKDAFAIALMKHSGEIRKFLAHWFYDDKNINTINLMKELSFALNGKISDKFIYNLREEFSRLIDSESNIKIDNHAFVSEISRLITRACDRSYRGDGKILACKLGDFYSHLTLRPFDNFMGFLEITNSIAKEII